ncbi:MAG: hypothetical protein AB1750_18075 [Chloroflexota bacterium]
MSIAIQNQSFIPILSWLETISIYFGIIGLATGMASGLSRYSNKTAWVTGIITASLTLLAEIGLNVVSMF